jgi:hypothetical protein
LNAVDQCTFSCGQQSGQHTKDFAIGFHC